MIVEINDRCTIPYFGFSGGFIGTFMAWQNSGIQTVAREFLQNDITYPGFVYLSGASGVISSGVIDNLRIGLEGKFGTNRQTHTLSGNRERSLEVGISMTNMLVEYMVTPWRHVAIGIGGGIGFGRETLEFSEYSLTQPIVFPIGTAFVSSRMQTSMLLLQPSINVEYSLTSFSMLRFGAGYTVGFLSAWEMSGSGIAVQNTPDLSFARGGYVQFGVFIGLFNN